MDGHKNEHSMVEQASVWAQRIIGPLVVAGIVAIFGAGVFTRDAVSKLDSRVSKLEKWSEKTDSNRYKREDGILERITRETADKAIREKQDELDAENIRLWASIRKHIERGEHQGADYRLRTLEKHLENDHK